MSSVLLFSISIEEYESIMTIFRHMWCWVAREVFGAIAPELYQSPPNETQKEWWSTGTSSHFISPSIPAYWPHDMLRTGARDNVKAQGVPRFNPIQIHGDDEYISRLSRFLCHRQSRRGCSLLGLARSTGHFRVSVVFVQGEAQVNISSKHYFHIIIRVSYPMYGSVRPNAPFGEPRSNKINRLNSKTRTVETAWKIG
jgi:hypothetical protein